MGINMARYINIASIHFNVSERKETSTEEALKQFREAEERLDGTHVDLVVTCEGMAMLGQTMSQAESLERPGPLFAAYREFARRNRCTIAGSLKLKDGAEIYNALVFIGPDGMLLGDYRKKFLTPDELKQGLTPGNGARVVETPAGRLGGVICFDLNFDALRNEYRDLHPDILCFSSMFHGGHLQANWAYQCRCFLAAACKDNTSNIMDPLGRLINSANFYSRISWARINLDRFIMHQDGNIAHFPDIRRRYGNKVLIDAAPDLGVAVLYALDHDTSAVTVAQEFGLVGIDDFFSSCCRTLERKTVSVL